MIFKQPHMEAQFEELHPLLKEICFEFVEWSLSYKIDPVITRVSDKVEGESGVHPAKRAVDFRNEFVGPLGKRMLLYSSDQAEEIVNMINVLYPRKDKYKTIMHHSFRGMPYHFHIQIPSNINLISARRMPYETGNS